MPSVCCDNSKLTRFKFLLAYNYCSSGPLLYLVLQMYKNNKKICLDHYSAECLLLTERKSSQHFYPEWYHKQTVVCKCGVSNHRLRNICCVTLGVKYNQVFWAAPFWIHEPVWSISSITFYQICYIYIVCFLYNILFILNHGWHMLTCCCFFLLLCFLCIENTI